MPSYHYFAFVSYFLNRSWK